MSEDAEKSAALVKIISPLLAGQGPDVQFGALADLLAILLAGFAPQLRETVLADFINCVRALVDVNEKIIFGEDGHPARNEMLQ